MNKSHKQVGAEALATLTVFSFITLFLLWIDFIPEPHSDTAQVVYASSSTTDTSQILQPAPQKKESVYTSTSTSAVTPAQTWRTVHEKTVRTKTTETGIASATEAVLVRTRGAQVPQVPTRIVAKTVGIDTSVLSPASTDVDVLNRALLSGAVYYPGSGTVGTPGNALIFGHSSYLPVVHNKAFKAFNGLQKLKVGDIIDVYTQNKHFAYRVEKVYLADADDEEVYFDATKPTLTLATCNVFGAKQERWIVEALQINSKN